MATKGLYTYDYPRPMLTADCVVVNEKREVLLVRRGGEPFKGCWALPGGFMEMDETIEHCAVRELEEETGLKVSEKDIEMIGVYSAPGRDPRGRTVTAAYAMTHPAPLGHPSRGEGTESFLSPSPLSEGGLGGVRAGDDAAEVRWWPLDKLPPLAFDHTQIVADACRG